MPASQETNAPAQTLQQQRAKYALEAVNALLDTDVNQKELKSYAAGFPAMIRMNGLGQAAAFYFSQGKTYKQLYHLLSEWLKKTGQPYQNMDLLDGITQKGMDEYRLAQVEAFLLLDWVKRFVKAKVVDQKEENGEDKDKGE